MTQDGKGEGISAKSFSTFVGQKQQRAKEQCDKEFETFTLPPEGVWLASWNPTMMVSFVCADNRLSWKQTTPCLSVRRDWASEIAMIMTEKNKTLNGTSSCSDPKLFTVNAASHMHRSARLQNVASMTAEGRSFTSNDDSHGHKQDRGKDAKTELQMIKTAGWGRPTHPHSVSILTGAILDSSDWTGCHRFADPQALAQVLNGARLSSPWRDNRKPHTDVNKEANTSSGYRSLSALQLSADSEHLERVVHFLCI